MHKHSGGVLTDRDWKAFGYEEIFKNIGRGKRLKKDDHIIGKMPYVSSTAQNNGVDGFVGNDEKVRVYQNCLTVANSGSVGTAFYQPFEFVASDHVTALGNSKLNEYSYQFLATLVSRLAKIIHMYMLTTIRFFCIVLLKGGNVYVT